MGTLGSFEICNPSDPTLIQTYPDACFDGANYVVVWSDEKIGSANYYYVTGARVTPGGVVLDTGTCISTGTGSSEYRAKIAYDGNRCLVVWPQSSTIYGRFVNSSGQPEGNIFTIASGGAGGPAVSFDGTNYLVVYQAGTWPNYNIYGQRVSPQGTPIGSPITIALDNGDTLRWPDVTFDGVNFLVVWMSGPNNPGPNYIHGQGVASDGSLIGSNFMISDNTSTTRWWPVVASSDLNYLVTWGQGTSSDVYGNVDIEIIGVEEESVISPPTKHKRLNTIIFSGPLLLPADKKCRVFDIAGKTVVPDKIRPGVYFIEIDNKIVQKVVKIR
jgi:hypothetical protein